MITLKSIRDEVIEWIEDDSIDDLIDREINSIIRFVTTDEFEGLKRSVNITPDSDGVIICPPAYRMCLGLYPECTSTGAAKFEFFPRTKRVRIDEPRTNRHLYHTHESTRRPAMSGGLASGVKGGYTLTETTTPLTDDMLGRELKVIGDNTRYFITSVTAGTSMDIFPSLRSSTSTSISFEIDPAGMRRYSLTNNIGEAYLGTVTMDYQIDHPPLVNDDDELLIPLERTVALMVVQKFLQQSKYDVDAQRLENSIFLARSAEYGTESTNRQDAAPRDTMFAMRSKRRRR